MNGKSVVTVMITDLGALVAAISSIIALVARLWTPKKYTSIAALTVYGVSVLLFATLVLTSGGITSPFIAAWFGVSLLAGYFGTIAVTAVTSLTVAQVIMSYLSQDITPLSSILALLIGLSPIITGLIIWHRQSSKRSDNSFSDLASRLSSAEGKSDIVISAISDGVVAISDSGSIELINPSAQVFTGWTKSDAVGLDWRSVLKLISEDGKEVVESANPIATALATNKPTQNDKLFLTTDGGKKRLMSIESSPIGPTRSGIIVVFRDITKEKADEREQAEFISTASHEMRTPVASIEGYLGLALNPATATIDEKARDFITKAHQSAQHLGQLFQDLLDISKSEDGRLANNPKVIDASTTVEGIFEGLAHLADEKNIRHVFKKPTLDGPTAIRHIQPMFYVDVDPGHFREVVSNLIENAIKYTNSGEVVVDVTGDDNLVTVSVQDSGIGIPSEDIPHLFQKFYRVDNTDTREIGGTGLGLYLCRRLAEAMGGRLRVESEYKKGSTFFLDIPRMGHEEAMRKIDESLAKEETLAIISHPAPVAPMMPDNSVDEVESVRSIALDQPSPAPETPVSDLLQINPYLVASADTQSSSPTAIPSTQLPPPPEESANGTPSQSKAQAVTPPSIEALQADSRYRHFSAMTLEEMETTVAQQPVASNPAPQHRYSTPAVQAQGTLASSQPSATIDGATRNYPTEQARSINIPGR